MTASVSDKWFIPTATSHFTLTIPIPLNRLRREAEFYRRLEPYAGKLARTVLRGEGGSNAADLLDSYDCTNSLLASKKAQYPEHYRQERMARYGQDIKNGRKCADCVGLIKGYCWRTEDGGHRYASGGCPDKSADGMFERAVEKGEISTMPELPGVLVRFAGHVGVYVGGGSVIEARGFDYGVVETRLSRRPWTHWYKLHCIDYAGAAGVYSPVLGERTLKSGCSGDDVAELQRSLEAAGCPLPVYGADGDFGGETESAVIALQLKLGITPDGVYGARTHAALSEMLIGAPEEAGASARATVTVTGDDVNVRAGPGLQYEKVTSVRRGAVLPLGDSSGWTPVMALGRFCYICSSYAKIDN